MIFVNILMSTMISFAYDNQIDRIHNLITMCTINQYTYIYLI